MPSFKLNINNTAYIVDAEADMPLLWVLRDLLNLTGTKYGCGVASCGACTIMIDGNAASKAANRFMIVFASSGTVPVTYTSVKAWQQSI